MGGESQSRGTLMAVLFGSCDIMSVCESESVCECVCMCV